MRRESRRARALAKQEIDELAECTFRPSINPNGAAVRAAAARARPATATALVVGEAPVVVRGLGRHLELCRAAKDKREAKARRERSVFGDGSRYAGAPTRQRPFNLSAKNHAKLQGRKREIELELDRECTFAPLTNERLTREVLETILDDNMVDAFS